MNPWAQRILFVGLGYSVLLYPNAAHSGWWLPEAKSAYINRCATQMTQQNVSDARGMCECVASALEQSFGPSEYQIMMQSQPNPNGSGADRRMYAALKPCVAKYFK